MEDTMTSPNLAYTITSAPFQMFSVSHLCSLLVFFALLALLHVLRGKLTPELFYPFPHFRFFHFFVAHEGIVLACLYMSWVKGYRPTFSSVWKTMISLNVLLLIALGVNRWTGGNYLFVSHKPEQPGLMDFLGPHPWYILSLEGVAFLFFSLLYLPFWVKNRSKARSQSLDA